jgi:hypothetical protein
MSIRKESRLENLDGVQLKFSLTDEQDIYFKQLKEAWK